MAIIAGLTTDILRDVDSKSMTTITALVDKLDPIYLSGFLKELQTTLDANTRILLLEGVNGDIRVMDDLLAAYNCLKIIGETLGDNRTEHIQRQVSQIASYLNRHVYFNFKDGLNDQMLLTDFKSHATKKEVVNPYYTSPLIRLYQFVAAAKKSTKFPDAEGNIVTVKHSYVIPDRLADLIEDKDIAIKYLAIIASLLEQADDNGRRDLLHLFMYIDKKTASELNSIKEQHNLNFNATIEDIRLIMYNLLLMASFYTFTELNNQAVDSLDIDRNQLINAENPLTGYNLNYFTLYNRDMLELLSEDDRKALAKLWRAYAYYTNFAVRNSRVVGYTRDLYATYGYLRRYDANNQVILDTDGNPKRFMYDPKQYVNELFFLAIKVVINANQNHVQLPSSNECERLMNTFIETLAQDQYIMAEDYDYNASIVKQSDYLIRELKEKLESAEESINNNIERTLSLGQLDNELNALYKESLKKLDGIRQMLDRDFTQEDWNLIPDNIADWQSYNKFLGPEYMADLATERAIMRIIYDRLNLAFEAVKYRKDMFAGDKVQQLNKDARRKITVGLAKDMTDGDLKYHVGNTRKFTTNWKNKIYENVCILQQRVKLITTYEDASFNTATHYNALQRQQMERGEERRARSLNNTSFDIIKKEYATFIKIAVERNKQRSTIINDAFTLHYGHAEVNTNYNDYLSREKTLEPISIEQSRTKHYVENTIKQDQDLYLELEAREFLILHVANDREMVTPYF